MTRQPLWQAIYSRVTQADQLMGHREERSRAWLHLLEERAADRFNMRIAPGQMTYRAILPPADFSKLELCQLSHALQPRQLRVRHLAR